jgi:hypothetical protein
MSMDNVISAEKDAPVIDEDDDDDDGFEIVIAPTKV